MKNRMSTVVQHLRQAMLRCDWAGLDDGELLEHYRRHGNEDAFAALMRRHGPMVLGVCRRILRHPEDAEDAFQATFLVLIRKADAIVPCTMVGNWLYGVAYRIARKGQALAARRRRRERQVDQLPEAVLPLSESTHDLRPLLDRELCRLPEKYRAPVVLCDLEGKTRKEAANQLGWPLGTVSGRLVRARTLLARRLARQHPALPLAAVLAENAASTQVPGLIAGATRAALEGGTGTTAAGSALSARAVALAEGVLKAMFLEKIKFAVVMFLVLALAGLAVHSLAGPAASRAEEGPGRADRAAPPAAVGLRGTLESFEWSLVALDVKERTIQVRMLTNAHCMNSDDILFHQLEEQTTWSNTPIPMTPAGSRLGIDHLPVPEKAEIHIDSKEGTLAALQAGMRLTLKLAAGQPTVVCIDAHSVSSGGEAILKAVDVDAKTISVSLGGKDLTLTTSTDVLVLVNNGAKGGLASLERGMRVSLMLGVDKDRLSVKRILAKKE
jgi:RNA polymerase sigma factor (sigma-70 family)